MDNWFHTLKSDKEQKDSLETFIKICYEIDLNSLGLELGRMSNPKFVTMEEENKSLKEKGTSQDARIVELTKEKEEILK